MRRAQAGLEYLVTYGWAFLVILVAVGALAYFGVINPSKWVPERCDFGQQLECVDHSMEQDYKSARGGIVRLYMRNNFGKDITITGVKQKLPDGTAEERGLMDPTGIIKTTINLGTTDTVELWVTKVSGLRINEKQEAVLIFTFQRNDGTLNPSSHAIVGSVYATVKDAS